MKLSRHKSVVTGKRIKLKKQNTGPLAAVNKDVKYKKYRTTTVLGKLTKIPKERAK